MNNQSSQVPEFINHDGEANKLWQYVSSMSPETISQLSQPASNEVFQVIERNITGMLGNLPPEHFGMMVTTSREQLGRLLASSTVNKKAKKGELKFRKVLIKHNNQLSRD